MTKVSNLIFKTLEIYLKSSLNGNFFSAKFHHSTHFYSSYNSLKNSAYNRSADRCWTIAAGLTAQLYLFSLHDSNWYRFNCGSYQQEPFNSTSAQRNFLPISWLLVLETAFIFLFLQTIFLFTERQLDSYFRNMEFEIKRPKF